MTKEVRVVRLGAAAWLALALAACGPAAAPGAQRAGGACALLTQPEAVLGANAQGVVSNDIEGSAGSCSWSSADGARIADLILYDAPATTQVNAITSRWTAEGVTPQAIQGLGDEAHIGVGLTGDQSQVVLRKGERVAILVATSGDPSLTSEQLARQLATQVAAAL